MRGAVMCPHRLSPLFFVSPCSRAGPGALGAPRPFQETASSMPVAAQTAERAASCGGGSSFPGYHRWGEVAARPEACRAGQTFQPGLVSFTEWVGTLGRCERTPRVHCHRLVRRDDVVLERRCRDHAPHAGFASASSGAPVEGAVRYPTRSIVSFLLSNCYPG